MNALGSMYSKFWGNPQPNQDPWQSEGRVRGPSSGWNSQYQSQGQQQQSPWGGMGFQQQSNDPLAKLRGMLGLGGATQQQGQQGGYGWDPSGNIGLSQQMGNVGTPGSGLFATNPMTRVNQRIDPATGKPYTGGYQPWMQPGYMQFQ